MEVAVIALRSRTSVRCVGSAREPCCGTKHAIANSELMRFPNSHCVETLVSAENWHEERERLIRLLKAIKSGEITHIDQEDLRELQATNPENIAALEERLRKLNVRLGRT